MDAGVIAALVSIGLSFAAAVLGARYRRVKVLLKAVVDAAEDDEISEQEFQEIIAKTRELMGDA